MLPFARRHVCLGSPGGVIFLNLLFYFACAKGCCCVPNYRGNLKNGPKVRTFSLVKEPARRALWKKATNRDDVDLDKLKDPQAHDLYSFNAKLFYFVSAIRDCCSLQG